MKRISTGFPSVTLPILLMMLLLSFSSYGEELVDATATYDPNNVFARILRGESPADVVYESENASSAEKLEGQRTGGSE